MVDALAVGGDEGRSSLRKASGSWQASFDPGMSEWGNPPFQGTTQVGRTWGTETSKYPEEKKSTDIPLVAASERGTADQPMSSGTVWKVRRYRVIVPYAKRLG